MTERLCVIVGCVEIGAHHNDCANSRCRGCRPRIAETPRVCNADRVRIRAELSDLGGLYAELSSDVDPVDHTEWTVRQRRMLPIPTTNPARLPAWLSGPWIKQAGAEPLAQQLPMGVTHVNHGARVTGSPAPAAPANLDIVDLTGPARAGSIDIIYKATGADWAGWWRNAGGAGDPDQIGHLAIATILDFWARETLAIRPRGERLPAPDVPALVHWLTNRIDDLFNRYPAIDEFAAKITALRHIMQAKAGLTPGRKEHLRGVGCRSCNKQALFRDGGYVQCVYCGEHYNDKAYKTWIGIQAGFARSDLNAAYKAGETVGLTRAETYETIHAWLDWYRPDSNGSKGTNENVSWERIEQALIARASSQPWQPPSQLETKSATAHPQAGGRN